MRMIVYICDRKKCENCHDYCHYTTDIEHAVNFQNLSDDVWFEIEKGPERSVEENPLSL